MTKWIGVVAAAVVVAGAVGVVVYETYVNSHAKCLADAECPDGQHCVDGKCTDAGCKATGCPEGQHCDDKSGSCVPEGTFEKCDVDADCPARGFYCYKGKCV